MHSAGIKSKGFEALVCIGGFCGGPCIRCCGVWVVSGGLYGGIGVGRGRILMGRGPRGD